MTFSKKPTSPFDFSEGLTICRTAPELDISVITPKTLQPILENHQTQYQVAVLQLEDEVELYLGLYDDLKKLPESAIKEAEQLLIKGEQPTKETPFEVKRAITLQQALVLKDTELKQQYRLIEFHQKLVEKVRRQKSMFSFLSYIGL